MACQDFLTNLFLLQVLDRWCMSPRTIEVLMNTYCVVQLPEEAKGLVPPEILQVSTQDPEHITQIGPRETIFLVGQPCLSSIEITQQPAHIQKNIPLE